MRNAPLRSGIGVLRKAGADLATRTMCGLFFWKVFLERTGYDENHEFGMYASPNAFLLIHLILVFSGYLIAMRIVDEKNAFLAKAMVLAVENIFAATIASLVVFEMPTPGPWQMAIWLGIYFVIILISRFQRKS